ncbi:hypothetical protein NA57DRAFT_61844 [Rhizodiscina lignyota]|uniref:Uncharacterized protein n=1 Tax=Rhizodiscina lignyota TaxID=1504668 RepID=A0A9P4I5C3_9PEZI|nr:hypothetical protein NA57DRAFT_61844 [Rhizodiscina lignyota]
MFLKCLFSILTVGAFSSAVPLSTTPGLDANSTEMTLGKRSDCGEWGSLCNMWYHTNKGTLSVKLQHTCQIWAAQCDWEGVTKAPVRFHGDTTPHPGWVRIHIHHWIDEKNKKWDIRWSIFSESNG